VEKTLRKVSEEPEDTTLARSVGVTRSVVEVWV
jgi:hypothetical protein